MHQSPFAPRSFSTPNHPLPSVREFMKRLLLLLLFVSCAFSDWPRDVTLDFGPHWPSTRRLLFPSWECIDGVADASFLSTFFHNFASRVPFISSCSRVHLFYNSPLFFFPARLPPREQARLPIGWPSTNRGAAICFVFDVCWFHGLRPSGSSAPLAVAIAVVRYRNTIVRALCFKRVSIPRRCQGQLF